MSPSGPRDKLIFTAIGLLVLLGPALILVLTLEVLILLSDIELEQISLIVFLELYIIDFILFVGLSYGIYRLTLRLVDSRLPATLNALEARGADESPDDESEPTEDVDRSRK